MKAKVLITGAGGQLGRELLRAAPAQQQCLGLGRADLDIGDAQAIRACLQESGAQLLINAAAYTAVDKAETDAAEAARVNAEAPALLAAACREAGVRLLHVSTDFVFDGSASTPYLPDSKTAPIGEYGRSKLAGEQALLAELPSALVIRTAWVYSAFGANFVKTMLRLMAERDELAVVADQVGSPTWARGLAEALWSAAERPQLRGIYHWTDAGVCSWYDFAVAICEEGCALGLLADPVVVRPIPGSEYPTPARRPAYSVLDCGASRSDLGLEGRHWRSQLRSMLRDLKEMENG